MVLQYDPKVSSYRSYSQVLTSIDSGSGSISRRIVVSALTFANRNERGECPARIDAPKELGRADT